jgi:hypothetical protein
MPARRDRFARPFLELTRRQTESIIRAQGLEAWHDPTNQPGGPYVSIRGQVRAELLPAARRILGEGFERALARTAARLAEDRDYLDAQVTALLARAASGRAGTASDNLDAASVIVNPAGGLATDQTETTVPVVLDIDRLAAAHPAIRRRALHRAALAAGARAGSLNAAQIEALDNLIGDWRGQGPVHLAGGILGRRKYGKLEFRKAPKET